MSGGIKKIFKKVVPLAIMGTMAYFTGGAAAGAMGIGGAGATGGMLAASNAAGGVMGAGTAASGGFLGSLGSSLSGIGTSLFKSGLPKIAGGLIQNGMNGSTGSMNGRTGSPRPGTNPYDTAAQSEVGGAGLGGLPGWLEKHPSLVAAGVGAASGYYDGKLADAKLEEEQRQYDERWKRKVRVGSFSGRDANGIVSRGMTA